MVIVWYEQNRWINASPHPKLPLRLWFISLWLHHGSWITSLIKALGGGDVDLAPHPNAVILNFSSSYSFPFPILILCEIILNGCRLWGSQAELDTGVVMESRKACFIEGCGGAEVCSSDTLRLLEVPRLLHLSGRLPWISTWILLSWILLTVSLLGSPPYILP